ncbi:N-acetyltransferase [Streptomyces sp. NBC_01275]|uniref:GNAT family N-acetyltransferase n=1 Tax=Streptomyces sp. NBC_01275 TaxID=2903807 RepID=UPI002250F537|nr:GNAT family N-acetyltransferase [Streptomyces sp. NBC_01275]MCX4760391.1 N-acetyltransferase [Streptomyces sp. NBC_01275]
MMSTVPVGLAEQTEIRAYVDFMTGAPVPVRESLGINSLTVGPASALAVREDASGFFTRAGGFDARENVTEDVVDQVSDFYRRQGVSQGAFMIAPSLLPPDWASTAAKWKLTEGGRHAKLWCEADLAAKSAGALLALDPGLSVGLVEPHQAHEWATVMMTTFGFGTPGMIDTAASCVGRPNWRQYAVWEGERIIAVGSVFLNGRCADMFGGATLPEGRGRGAQSALLAARARAARAAGCRWLVAETGAERPGSHNTSLHNMIRIGFEPLYERATWLWHA